MRVLDDEPETSKEGVDAGSTFFVVKCIGCDSQVGKVYLTTPRALDLMRDAFSFDSERIKNYVLGEHELTLGDEQKEEGARDPDSSVGLTERVGLLEEQLLKVENLLLLYNERLERLEGDRLPDGMKGSGMTRTPGSPRPSGTKKRK